MNSAAFDLATTTGIAIDYGDSIRAFSWKAKAKRPEGYGPSEIVISYEAAIVEEFRKMVWSLLIQEDVECVAFEEPRKVDYGGAQTQVVNSTMFKGRKEVKVVKKRSSNNLAMVRQLNLATTLVGVCNILNIKSVEVPVDSWRDSFLGFSKLPRSFVGEDARRREYKRRAIERCQGMGIEVQNSDAADAVGVLFHLRGMINPQKFRRANDLFNLAPTGGVL